MVNNPFLSPAKKLDIEMQELAAGNREIEVARARAEVAYLQEQRQCHWDDQPLDAADWKANAPPLELPGYWAAGVEFTATWVLGYAQAAASAVTGPRHFEKLVDHCISVLADWTYDKKLSRYAKVKQPQLAFMLIRFRRDVRRTVENQLGDLKLQGS